MNNGSETIFVIGADSDIGGEIIKTISRKGNTVLAHYFMNESKVKNLTKILPDNIVPIKADFSRAQNVFNLIECVKKNHEIPDKIVFLAAKRMMHIRFKDIEWEDFQADLDIQLRSSMLISRELLPAMAKKDGGKVVFVLSSVTLGVPPKALSNYVTVKYAMLGLMKSLAAEYADKKINVNAVSPSMTETSFLNEINEKVVELAAESHPLKRNARPADIAPAVKFLLSKDADYISGANLPVAGGLIF